jgi:hypothetical protein
MQHILERNIKLITSLNPSLDIASLPPILDHSTKSIRELLSLFNESEVLISQESLLFISKNHSLAPMVKKFKEIRVSMEKALENLNRIWQQSLKIENLVSQGIAKSISRTEPKWTHKSRARDCLKALESLLEETQLRLILINTDLQSMSH